MIEARRPYTLPSELTVIAAQFAHKRSGTDTTTRSTRLSTGMLQHTNTHAHSTLPHTALLARRRHRYPLYNTRKKAGSRSYRRAPRNIHDLFFGASINDHLTINILNCPSPAGCGYKTRFAPRLISSAPKPAGEKEMDNSLFKTFAFSL